MQNIIIVKDSLVILPYIKNIPSINIDMDNLLFYFRVESMVAKDVLIYGDKFEFDLGKYTPRLLLSMIPSLRHQSILNKDKFFEVYEQIKEYDTTLSITKEDCYNDLKSKYDDLNEKREKLIGEWDKSISLIKRI